MVHTKISQHGNRKKHLAAYMINDNVFPCFYVRWGALYTITACHVYIRVHNYLYTIYLPVFSEFIRRGMLA